MARYSPKLPPLKTLEVFESAYRHQSFTRAASELALSQTSVSRRVRELEDDLGCSLFVRQRHDVLPTEESHRLADVVRSALQEIAITSEELRHRASGSCLTVFTDISLGSAVLSPLVMQYNRENPDVRIKLLSSYEPIESTLDYFDIGLVYGQWADDRYDIQPVADELVFPVCSASFADKHGIKEGTQEGISELASLPLLNLSEINRGWPSWRDFFEHHNSDAHIDNSGLEFNSYQVCLHAAEQGEGVALGWGHSVKDAVESGKLVRIGDLSLLLPAAICLYQPKQRLKNPNADIFVDLLIDKLRKES